MNDVVSVLEELFSGDRTVSMLDLVDGMRHRYGTTLSAASRAVHNAWAGGAISIRSSGYGIADDVVTLVRDRAPQPLRAFEEGDLVTWEVARDGDPRRINGRDRGYATSTGKWVRGRVVASGLFDFYVNEFGTSGRLPLALYRWPQPIGDHPDHDGEGCIRLLPPEDII